MTAPDFPPEVIKKAARALCDNTEEPMWSSLVIVRRILAAVADDLRAEGAAASSWSGAYYSEGRKRGRAEGARQVLAEMEASDLLACSGDTRWHRRLREAVAKIEKGAGA